MATILLQNIPLFIIAIYFLWKGSEWLVTSASQIAHAWGVSDLVIGLTVVAIGTSAPEFAVTTVAVLNGSEDISVSNVIGSNIFNLGFILGGTACFRAIATSHKLVYRDGIFLISTTLLLGYLLFGAGTIDVLLGNAPASGLDLSLSRVEGSAMLLILIAYLAFLFIKKEPLEEEDISHEKASLRSYTFLLLGLIGVVGGGHLLVESATHIAKAFGVSDWVIGVTIVAAGTSAPEFATAMMAVLKNRHGMAIGNLIGSDLFNLLGVLGLAAILGNPLGVSAEAFSSVVMLVVMVSAVVLMMRIGWKISRLEGFILVSVNLARWIFDFSGKS